MGRGGVADMTLWGVCGFLLGSAFSLAWVGADEERRFTQQQKKEKEQKKIQKPTEPEGEKQPAVEVENTQKIELKKGTEANTSSSDLVKQNVASYRKELGLDSSPSGYRRRKSIEVQSPSECPVWYQGLDEKNKEEITEIIGENRKPSRALENSVMDHVGKDRKDVAIFLKWWFQRKAKNERVSIQEDILFQLFPPDLFSSDVDLGIGMPKRQQSLDENLSDLAEGITTVEMGLDQAAIKLNELCCNLGDGDILKHSIEDCLGILGKTQSLVHSLGEHTTMTSTQVVNIRDYLMTVRDDEGIAPGEREVAKWITQSYLQIDSDPPTQPRQSLFMSSSLQSFRSIDSLESLDNPEMSEKIDEECGYAAESMKLLFIPAVEKCINKLGQWDFDIFEFDSLVGGDQTLPLLGVALYKKLLELPFVNKIYINEKILYNYLSRLSEKYYPRDDVPYHNSLHASDVMATMLYVVTSKNFVDYDFYAVLSSLLACAAHDVEHNGFTNTFHINSASELALRYNDKAVLENHHCAVGWKLLTEKPSVLTHIKRSKLTAFRNIFVTCILATDMATHKDQLIQLEDFPKQHDVSVPLDSSTAISVLPKLMHTADISNVAKPFDMCNRWVELLMTEFFNQGDVEKERGLTVSPLCDREITDIDASEVAFIKFICDPWFDLLAAVIPDISSPMVDNLASNYRLFKGRAMASHKETEKNTNHVLVRRNSVNINKFKNTRRKVLLDTKV